MHWLLLLAAIAAEVAGTTFMKLSMGFTKLGPSILLAVCYLLSLTMLNLALKSVSMSVAYAVWSGAGTALVAGIGWVLFGERMSLLKIVCILLIIAGVAGLNLVEESHGEPKNSGSPQLSTRSSEGTEV
ncbi:DMT family transporter [Paenibacillus sp. URB8-2]|uniref:DMT family transporter n=1 Tax=Paenibacillus sp. URB8-2 TaxID=2741301 RepID=UPI0015B8868D|nr:multidrug efflux SMR transporter [Paenibacillus sp. URB8-2]BCG61556.1 multidrug SMR transporter [Paenibacillus sp. URB8-2]